MTWSARLGRRVGAVALLVALAVVVTGADSAAVVAPDWTSGAPAPPLAPTATTTGGSGVRGRLRRRGRPGRLERLECLECRGGLECGDWLGCGARLGRPVGDGAPRPLDVAAPPAPSGPRAVRPAGRALGFGPPRSRPRRGRQPGGAGPDRRRRDVPRGRRRPRRPRHRDRRRPADDLRAGRLVADRRDRRRPRVRPWPRWRPPPVTAPRRPACTGASCAMRPIWTLWFWSAPSG